MERESNSCLTSKHPSPGDTVTRAAACLSTWSMGAFSRREGFVTAVIGEQATGELAERDFTSAAQLLPAIRRCAPEYWAGFQLYYSMPEKEVRACTGLELVKAICGVFAEVTPVMNCCMQVPLTIPRS